MSSRAVLYLVSACGSAEEFVSAFRRYADRTGLFVPTAAPLPAGRRGRIAVTLKDGGVMIEGEAEILQSSAKPTVLQGRPGMTIKFVEPDEPSKVVIAELEKARLAMRPPPPTVPPRPASIPAEPRPVPPAPGGRIDASNALAECVVIGDASALRDTANAPKSVGDAGSGKGKFVVPSIPRPGSPSTPPATERPKPATIPPVAAERPKPSTVPPPVPALPPNTRMTSIGFPIVDPKLPASGKVGNATTLGMPALRRDPEKPPSDAETTAVGAKPADDEATAVGAVPPSKSLPVTDDEATAFGAVPVATAPSPSGGVPRSGPTRAQTEMGSGITHRPPTPEPPKTPAAPASGKHAKMTSIGFPAMSRTPFETQPVGVVQPPKDGEPSAPVVAKPPATPPRTRGKPSTAPPPGPRHPTPAAPLPVVRLPAKGAPPIALTATEPEPEDEKTDLSAIEDVASQPTELPPETPVPQVDPYGATQTVPSMGRSGGMRASEIMAAIPTEDWTMTPDASAPTVLSKPEVEGEPTPAPGPAPKGPPTGNWTISLDPETGWSEPEKVTTPAPPVVAQPPKRTTGGNPNITVSSDKAISAVEWEEKPTGIGEAKIEIDPTLMGPHKPMPGPGIDDAESPPLVTPPLPPSRMPAPPQGLFAQAAQSPQFPPPPPASAFDLAASGSVASVASPSKKKSIVIAICAAAVVAVVAIVAVVFLGGGKPKTKPIPPEPGSAAIVTPPPVVADAAVVVEAPKDAAVEQIVETGSGSAAVETPPPPPPPTGPCKVSVASVPTGADVLLGKKKIGSTPTTIELPCGTESTLTLKKAKFLATPKTITPNPAKPNKLVVKLAKTMFTVKVTSTPAGATITVGGKSAGVTPAAVKLPGGEASTISISKPGFATDTSKVTPKSNGQAHHVTLKKATRR